MMERPLVQLVTFLWSRFCVDPSILFYDSSWFIQDFGKVTVSANHPGNDFYYVIDTVVSLCTVEIKTEGCPTVTTDYWIDEIVAIMEVIPGLVVRLFPNPAGENLFIQFDNKPSQDSYYYIVDLNGKHIVEPKPLSYPLQKVDINHLKPGVY
jgi:hypothetical protein